MSPFSFLLEEKMVEGGLKNNDAGKDGVSLIMLETFGAPSVVDAITEW